MGWGKYLFFIAFVFGLLSDFLCVSRAVGAVYPWVRFSTRDIQVLESPEVEAQVRLDLIQDAVESIDLVTFDQRADAYVGKPLIDRIRSAADRGVKVRFLTAWAGHFLKDFGNWSGHYLTTPPTHTPIEFKIIGGPPMWKNGWKLLDGIHEKLLIIDHRILLVTGRGHADEYLRWLDTAFLLKGDLVAQAAKGYEELWNTAIRENSPQKQAYRLPEHEKLKLRLLSRLQVKETPSLHIRTFDETLHHASRAITNWTKLPPVPFDQINPSELCEGRLLHHELLDQIRSLSQRENRPPSDYSTEDRVKTLADPIIEELITLLSRKEVTGLEFYSLSTTFSPPFLDALRGAAQRGVPIHLITNGKANHKSIAYMGLAIGWYAGLARLDDLMSSGLNVYELNSSHTESPLFTHRKVAVLDDIVIFGSHNFNISSTVESDEMSFEIKNAQFSQAIRDMFERNRQTETQVLNQQSVHQENIRSALEQWLSRLFEGLF